MTNLIVITFSNESKAIDGSHKLSELESFGDVSIFEKAMVKKDANGNVTVLESDTTDGLRTLSGMAIGTMLGALGGPVGLLVGMLGGTMTGALLDSDHFDFSEDFGAKVSSRLQPGTVALIAEISEEGPSIVDTALEPLAATISRSDVDYEYDEYEDDQVEEIDDEISAERAEFKSAVAGDKAKIQKKIDQRTARSLDLHFARNCGNPASQCYSKVDGFFHGGNRGRLRVARQRNQDVFERHDFSLFQVAQGTRQSI